MVAFVVEVKRLDGVQQGDAVLHRTLEGLAALIVYPSALVDHGPSVTASRKSGPARLAARD